MSRNAPWRKKKKKNSHKNGKSKGNAKKDDSQKTTKVKKKTMADCVFCVGSAKQASHYITTSQFLINHIKQTFPKGQDISKALETLEPIDFKAIEPKVKTKPLPALDEQKGITQTHVDNIKAENDLARAIHQSKILTWTKREQQYIHNLSTAPATIWSCCSIYFRSVQIA